MLIKYDSREVMTDRLHVDTNFNYFTLFGEEDLCNLISQGIQFRNTTGIIKNHVYVS